MEKPDDTCPRCHQAFPKEDLPDPNKCAYCGQTTHGGKWLDKGEPCPNQEKYREGLNMVRASLEVIYEKVDNGLCTEPLRDIRILDSRIKSILGTTDAEEKPLV